MNDIETVTPAMTEAGVTMANNLLIAQVAKAMGGAGGSMTWEEWVDKEWPNVDIIYADLEGKIMSVDAIYLAMQRAKEEESK